jgi:UDPglucose 6-dehydrogenase
MKISVIGCGYLGATHAACMAELGHEVLGIDTDASKIAALSTGRAPFREYGLDDLLAKHTSSGRLRFGRSFAEAADFADVHFLAVGTPQLPGSDAYDLSFLFGAAQQLAAHLRRPSLIIGKSTVPVGTAGRLAQFIRRSTSVGEAMQLAWNPEFLRESSAVDDTLHPDRIVVGLDREAEGAQRTEQTIRSLYAPVIEAGAAVLVTDLATAELTKTAANAFLATKISFINAMAEVSEAAGADIQLLTAALALDPRIGPGALRSGIGFGGGCLPKDLRGLVSCAENLGAGQAVSFLREVDMINARRRDHVIDLVLDQCGGSVFGQPIAVWGAAFKPGTDDIRQSPALAIAQELHRHGAKVTVYDPAAVDNARAAYPHLRYAHDAVSAVRGAQVLLHLTDWPEFSRVDPVLLGDNGVAAQRCVIDGRGTLDADRWRSAGWTCRALGTASARLSTHHIRPADFVPEAAA